MATLDVAIILARLRAVLETGTGDVRTISAGTYEGTVNESLPDDELSARAGETPRYRLRVTGHRPAPERPAGPSNVTILDLDLEVTIIRRIDPVANDSDTEWDTIHAAGVNDSSVIRQALEWPSNVGGTGGVISGSVQHLGSELLRAQFPQGGDDDRPGILEYAHRFTLKVLVNPATS